MELEMRAAMAEEMEEFMHVVHVSYGMPPDFSVKIQPEWTFCAFTGGRMVTSSAAWPLTLQFLNVRIPVAGVTWVATRPVYRRRNYLRLLKKDFFKHLYEKQEYPVAALFASMAAIYHRYGYGIVSTKNAYSVEPQYLRFAIDCPAEGDFKEADDGDMGVMLDLYHRFAEQRIGCLRRGEAMQVAPGVPFTVLRLIPPAQLTIRLIYLESGEPKGYLIYGNSRNSGPGDPLGQRVSILDLVWLSPSAYRAMWDLLARMDLARRIEWNRVPPDDPLPHLLLEPRKLNVTSSDGLLARIVDLERALPMRPYSREGTFTFEVIDDLCAWNRGRWKLTASKAKNEICRTEEEAQLVVPVSTLAMLMFGQISPSLAARMGRLDANDPRALPLWDSLMATPCRPFCADAF